LKQPTIKSKKKPTITKNTLYRYHPDTYEELHSKENFNAVEDVDAFKQKLLNSLKEDIANNGKAVISIDTETKAYNVSIDKLPPTIIRRFVKKRPQDVPFCISISNGIEAWAISGIENIVKLKDILEDPTIDKIIANAKFDMHMLANIDVFIAGFIWDPIVMCKLTNENRNSFSIEDMAMEYDADSNKWSIMKDIWLRENKCTDWSLVPKILMKDYACSDAFYEYLIYKDEAEILKNEDLMNLYCEEERLIKTLFRIERNGFKIDKEYVKELERGFEIDIENTMEAIFKQAGQVFNINSTKQLYEVLLKIGVDKKDIPFTAKKNPSLDKKVLDSLSEKYDIAHNIVSLRKLEKLYNTYAVNLSKQLQYGRVHCSFNQTEARTGRMSSSNINLQNIPKKDTRIRRAFIAEDEYVLFFWDYDQIEYKLFAHYCKDPWLIESIKKGWDVHRATAAAIFQAEYDEVTDEQRDIGKTLNFALIYGMGTPALASSLKINNSLAENFKYEYFKKMPNAKRFINTVQEVGKTRGYVKNYFNRRRRLGPSEVYKAVNSIIQGAAADVIKQKMNLVDEYLLNYKSRLVSVVHDELIGELHKSEVDTVIKDIITLMTDYNNFRVPITIGCQFSMSNWAEKVDYDINKSFISQIEEASY